MKISDLCDRIDYGLTASADKNPVGPKFLRITDIVQGSFDWKTVPYVRVSATDREKYALADGDIVIARTGATTGASRYISSPPECVFASYLIRIRAKATVDPRYLGYLLKTSEYKAHIYAVAFEKAAQPNASAKVLTELDVNVLPEPEQRNASSVLGSLDDKIELNRRMNETLEEMARALFRDWFVDFGPTRRQMEGATDPVAVMGHAFPSEKAAGLAPLFPSRLEDGGLPESWFLSDVGTEFDVVMGQSPPGETYNETGDGLPFFQGRRDFGFRFPSRRVYCTEPKRVSGRDWTLISVRAPVGDINRAVEKCAIGRGVGALLHKAGLHSLSYYTGLALRTELQSYDKDGTVFGSINQKQLKGLQVVVAQKDLSARFDEIAKPIDDKIRLNTEENQTLADMRDLLLPKLMSGEIRLKGA